jgi:hypothetical protein
MGHSTIIPNPVNRKIFRDYHDVGTARNAFCGNEKSLDGGMLLPVRCCRMRGNSGCQQEVELMV